MKSLKFLTTPLLKLLVLSSAFAAAPAVAQCGSCGGGAQSVSWNGWTFSFVRPCLTRTTTAGGRGGGLELRNVKFKGRSVLSRANTPVFNVKYKDNLCGPYRDWQYEESPFQCNGTVVSGGVGRCNGGATTNCNNPSAGDVGSFCGVSVNTSNPDQLVLTTMVKAGWYRYQIQWFFYRNGSMRPVINWTGERHPCINNAHLHNAYWRLDFDIDGATPNVVEESKDANVTPVGYWEKWDPLFAEMGRMRDSTAGVRKWRVRNTTTNRGYVIYPLEDTSTPGGGDGVATSTGVADFWALRYNSANQEETDDCFGSSPICSISSGNGYWAHTPRFVDQNADPSFMIGKDVVVWYGVSHYHPTGVDQTPPACERENGPLIAPDPEGPAW